MIIKYFYPTNLFIVCIDADIYVQKIANLILNKNCSKKSRNNYTLNKYKYISEFNKLDFI